MSSIISNKKKYLSVQWCIEPPGGVCDERSSSSDIWPSHLCILDFSISKELTKRANNCMSQSTWFTPRLLTSEHIFVARLKEYQRINKCQSMTTPTACDKRPACHLVLCRRDIPLEQDSRGLHLNFFFLFSAQPVTFSQPFSLLADGRKGLPAGASEQHTPPAHLLWRTKRHSGSELV